MMLKALTCTLAATATIFTLTAFGADPVPQQGATPPAPVAMQAPTAEEIASNPARYLRARLQADDMGYLYAVVLNPTDVAVANVHVIVVHFDEKTRQPDRQTVPLLVAAKLAPRQRAQVPIEGLQVFKPAEFKEYRALIQSAEVAK